MVDIDGESTTHGYLLFVAIHAHKFVGWQPLQYMHDDMHDMVPTTSLASC